MHKKTQPMSCSLPPPNQDSNKPSMAFRQVGVEPTARSPGGADDGVRTHGGAEDHLVPLPSAPPDDFEFCVLPSGGIAPAGDDAADMCVADEIFSGGRLLPLRLSSAGSAGAPALPRSDSLDGAATTAASTTISSGGGSSSRSVSRSSSSCVSRSTSSSSASSDRAGLGSSSSSKSASSADAAVPPRRSLSGSVFYAHPSPSPRPRRAAAPGPRRRRRGGVVRLGVVGAPEVYAPRPAEYRKAAASRSGSRSARFEQHGTADKKLALGLGLLGLGAGLVCSCSPDAVVAPVGSAEVAAAETRKKAEEKKRSATAEQSGKGTAWRSRILEWLEDLSISKEKSAAASCRTVHR